MLRDRSKEAYEKMMFDIARSKKESQARRSREYRARLAEKAGLWHTFNYVYLRAGGVPTRHTRKWDGLHTRRLLESTRTNTHKHTQTRTPL